MSATLKRFRVVGLHGFKNYQLSFNDNALIIVGENGSGKTTLLRMLFYFLSGRWQSLIQFQFQSVEAQIDRQDFKVTRDELVKAFRARGLPLLRRFPPSARGLIKGLIERGRFERLPDEIMRLGMRYGVPMHELERDISRLVTDETAPGEGRRPTKAIQEAMQGVQETMKAQILYLPTYRRIERELSSIFEGADSDDLRRYRQRQLESDQSYIELVEFGMKDVQSAVERSVESIGGFARENLNRLTLSYLSDVVNQTYLQVAIGTIPAIPQETVRSVIDRIDESILSGQSKEHLSEVISSLATKTGTMTDHERLVYHYFSTLLRFQESLQERERPISEFCDLCSQYISDKQFIYNSSTFSFSIVARGRSDMTKIELADLSSGEKQIVSLFSHLYLTGTSKFFVLIDEPELSLSVPWQRRFLPDIRNGLFCAGVVAATHSPFIYDNTLKQYAHSLDEFVES
jgi:ABC-type transport system involved in cytochrome c biogenesis ATPase subunit